MLVRTKTTHIALLTTLLLSSFHGNAAEQASLTRTRNLYASGSREVLPAGHFHAGGNGEGCLWDFSGIGTAKDAGLIVYSTDSTGAMSVTDGKETLLYVLENDSLKLAGIESALKDIRYAVPQTVLRFPFAYGDSISTEYSGEGTYCRDRHFRERGTATVIADAAGTVVTAWGDTIRNVLRLHTIRSCSVCMDIDTAALGTAPLRQVIEEHYQWYAPCCRFPIYETVTSTSYHDMNPVGTTRKAMCDVAGIGEATGGSAVDGNPQYGTESLRKDNGEDNGEDVGRAAWEKDIIRYTAAISGSMVSILYDLEEDAAMTALVASPAGMTYRISRWMQAAGQGLSARIDCSGLRPGSYILYMNVNGKTYSQTVSIR